MVIISYDILSEDHLCLNIQQKNTFCGAIDFIADKINFNLSDKSDFFKGLECIRNISTHYEKGKLSFVFSNKKQLIFECNSEVYEKINSHLLRYAECDNNRKIKNEFFK